MTSPQPSGPRNVAAPAPARCRNCGSRLRPEEDWCTLCHTSVVETPVPPKPVASEPVTASVAGGSQPGAEQPGIGRPVDPEVAAEADRLIKRLAAAEAERDRASGLASLSTRMAGRGSSVMVAAVGGGLLLVLVVLGLTLLGLLV